jgi:hypothetical protein
MSTNATIAYYDEETDSVKSQYLHWDGHDDSAGLTLYRFYKTLEKVKELVSLGNISILDENIGEKIDFNDRDLRRANKQCLFYARDRAESDQDFFEFSEYDDLLDNQGQEFNYLFVGDKWCWSGEYVNIEGDDLETTLREKGLIDPRKGMS